MNFGGTALASLGNTDIVLVTGQFWGKPDLGTGIVSNNGEYDLFLQKFDPSGKTAWVRAYGSAMADSGEAIAAEANANIWVVGTYRAAMSFGTGGL